MDRLLHPVPEAMHMVGDISRSKFYQLIRDGQLQLVKIGSRSFIPEESLRNFVDRLVGAET
jgi:predicted DNA-binding transcriptional regulator AlpA